MSATTLITKSCADCKRRVRVEIPDELTGMYRRLLEETPARCPKHEAENEMRWAERDRQREQAAAAQLVEQRERDCGLPLGLRRLALSDPDPARAVVVKAAEEWADGRLRGLLLIGLVGTGKTHLASAAAWHRLRYEPLRWSSASHLVAQLDSGFGSMERTHALGIVRSRRGLVIDDLDKARPSAYVAEALLLAIDTRITAGASLLVTMNTEPAELGKHFPEPFGEAIVSRLRAYCRGYRLGGQDRRVG
jgi:DNA replication protein DnaC